MLSLCCFFCVQILSYFRLMWIHNYMYTLIIIIHIKLAFLHLICLNQCIKHNTWIELIGSECMFFFYLECIALTFQWLFQVYHLTRQPWWIMHMPFFPIFFQILTNLLMILWNIWHADSQICVGTFKQLIKIMLFDV